MYNFVYNNKKYIVDLNKAKKLAEGHEGKIYDLTNGLLIKIFKKDIAEKMRKIKSMINYIYTHDHYYTLKNTSWPLGIVYDENNKEVGYIMKKCNGHPIAHLEGLEKTQKIYPNFTTDDLFDIAIKFIDTLMSLRRELGNFAIGDLSGMNVLVDEYKNVYFIDMDSISFMGYPCKVATKGYKAYETIRSKDGLYFSSKTDDFVCAIIVFSLLCEYHPYTNNAGKSYDNCITSQLCPLFNETQSSYKPFLKFEFKDILEELTLDVFRRYFIDGCDIPSNRPELSELSYVLFENKYRFKKCKKNSSHYYVGKKCPYCRQNKKKQSAKAKKAIKNVVNVKPAKNKSYQDNSGPKTLFLILAFILIFIASYNYILEGMGAMLGLLVLIHSILMGLALRGVETYGESIGLLLFSFFVGCLVYEILYKIVLFMF